MTAFVRPSLRLPCPRRTSGLLALLLLVCGPGLAGPAALAQNVPALPSARSERPGRFIKLVLI